MIPRQEELEAVRRWLRRQPARPLNPAGLLERIQSATGLASILAVNNCLRQMERAGEVRCDGWGPHAPLKRLHVNLPPEPLDADKLSWIELVEAVPDLTEAAKKSLAAIWEAVCDWPTDSRPDLINEILSFRHGPPAENCYLTSAGGRLGSSKLLSSLPRQALEGIGIPKQALIRTPPCFLLAGSADPDAVVLVENPNAFERAIGATSDLSVAWVSSYGFGAGALDAGERMAEGLRVDGTAISAVRSGAPPSLAKLMAAPNLLYWGDLDVAGLAIFFRLRVRFPHARLSALYDPMIRLLVGGGGHPYARATGKAQQQRNWACDDPHLMALFQLCHKRAVDQEYVQSDTIRLDCLRPLPRSPPL